jgi:hypothetical protein
MRPTLIVALVIVLIASYGLPGVIARWWTACRLYGGLPISLARIMLHYARRSPQRRVVNITFWMLLLPVFTFSACFIRGWPIEIAIVSLVPAIYFASGTANLLLPPSFILLSASSDQSTDTFTALAARQWFYRPVALLRPFGDLSPMMTIHLRMNLIRTIDDCDWRSTVFHLMSVVPLIVIDVRQPTISLEVELSEIRENRYQNQTLVIDQPTSVETLEALIRQRLSRPVDVEGRRQRQAEFVRTFFGTRPEARDQ